MTVKLYDTNPYETKFTAQVISCEPAADQYAVVLDRTLFFPEEGGQTPEAMRSSTTVTSLSMRTAR